MHLNKKEEVPLAARRKGVFKLIVAGTQIIIIDKSAGRSTAISCKVVESTILAVGSEATLYLKIKGVLDGKQEYSDSF